MRNSLLKIQPELIDKVAAAASYDSIKATLNELMGDVEGGLPLPELKIINNTLSHWNGRCIWRYGDPTTTIELQKSICHDENTMRRVLAHELAHHEQFIGHFAKVPQRTYNTMFRIEGGHGKTWLDIVARWNAKYGTDFITQTSDESKVSVHDEKDLYVLLWKSPRGMRWQTSINLSVQAIRSMWNAGKKTPNRAVEYKLIKTTDRSFLSKLNIGDRAFGYSTNPETMKKAAELFETGTDIWQQEVDTRINAPTKPIAKFFVLISKRKYGYGDYLWQQSTALNDKQKEKLGQYARMTADGTTEAKLVMSINLFLKAGAHMGGSRWSYSRTEDEIKALEEAWNAPDLLQKYKDVRSRFFSSLLQKDASPDFGYTKYRNREKDLKNVKFVSQGLEGEYFGVAAKYAGKDIGVIECSVVGKLGVVYNVEIDGYWRGTGLGQLLYDHAIQIAKKNRLSVFSSDDQLSDDAVSAWMRLAKRYPITEVDNFDYDPDTEADGSVPQHPVRYRIDLTKVPTKNLGTVKTATISPTDRTLYHGTNVEKEFNTLEPMGDPLIWLGEIDTAKDIYARYIYNKGRSRVIEVKLKPNAKLVDLTDANDPITQQYRAKHNEKLIGSTDLKRRGYDDEWLSGYRCLHTSDALLPWLRSLGVDGVIVSDYGRPPGGPTRNHHSVALLNMGAIESQQEMKAASSNQLLKFNQKAWARGTTEKTAAVTVTYPKKQKPKAYHFQPLPFKEFKKTQTYILDDEELEQKEIEYDENVEHFGTLDFPVTIYRALELPPGKSINFDEAGVYWTWVENSADAYYGGSSIWAQSGSGEKGELIIIKAQVMKPSDVDWQGTLRANFIDPEENELRVLPGTQLKLVGVQRGDDFNYKPIPGQMTITAAQKTLTHPPTHLPTWDDFYRKNTFKPMKQQVTAGAIPLPSFKAFVQSMGNIYAVANLIGDGALIYEEDFRDDSEDDSDVAWEKYLYRRIQGDYKELVRQYKEFKFPLALYRDIRLKSIEEFNTKAAGIYWTWAEGYSEAYNAIANAEGNDYTIKAIVNSSNDIDWIATLSANLHPGRGEEEMEITLKKGVNLTFVGYKEYESKDWIPLGIKTITAASQLPSLKEALAWGGQQPCDGDAGLGGDLSLAELVDWTAVEKECIQRVGNKAKWNKLSENAREEWEEEIGQEHLRRNWKETETRLHSLQFPLTIYRALDASLDEIELGYNYYDAEANNSTKGVGYYWSDSENSSYIQTQAAFNALVLRGAVDFQAVNWKATAWLNLVAPDESEIRLKSGISVKITGWRYKNETEWNLPPEHLKTVTANRETTEPYIDAHQSGTRVVIDMMWVPPDQRSKGVGTRYYKEWEKTVPADVTRIEMFAADTGGEGNSDKFWKSLGFDYKYDGEEDDLDYESAHWMWKGVNGHPTPKTVTANQHPRITEEEGTGLSIYGDGNVRAVFSGNENSGISIYEFSSYSSGQGNARKALAWLKKKYGFINVFDPGTEETSPESLHFWQHMQQVGLINKMFKDVGGDEISKSASHKQTPFSDTVFPDEGSDEREIINGEGTNGYALQPERVDDGNIIAPSVESMILRATSTWPTFKQFLDYCAEGKPDIISRLYSEISGDIEDENIPIEEKQDYILSGFNAAVKKLRLLSFPRIVWRMVRLTNPNQLRLKNIGTSWSTDIEKAQVIHETWNPGKDYLLQGKIDLDAVDIMDSIYWRMSPMGDDEDEVRLKTNASIYNLQIFDTDENRWKPSANYVTAALEGDGQSSFFEEVENPHSVQPLHAPDPPPLEDELVKTAHASEYLSDFYTFLKKQGGIEALVSEYDWHIEEWFQTLSPLAWQFNDHPADTDDFNLEEYVDKTTNHAYSQEEIEQFSPQQIEKFKQEWVYTKCLEEAEEYLRSRYEDLIEEHSNHGGTFDIFRCMTLSNLRGLKKSGFGVYWSWDEDSAEAHWGSFGKGQRKYYFWARVNDQNVDWDTTLLVNLNPSIGDDEKEIRVKEGTPLQLMGYKIEGDHEWRHINAGWKNVTAGAGDTNVFIPRHHTEDPALHRDPFDPALETEQEQWDAALPDHKVGSVPRSKYDKVCYEIAMNDELWSFLCGWVENTDAYDQYPEEAKQVERLIGTLPPISKTLYRGEEVRRGDDRLSAEWDGGFRNLLSWSLNYDTARYFAGNQGIVWQTVGRIQGVALIDIVTWRNRIHPNESHYGGPQAEWLVLNTCKAKEATPTKEQEDVYQQTYRRYGAAKKYGPIFQEVPVVEGAEAYDGRDVWEYPVAVGASPDYAPQADISQVIKDLVKEYGITPLQINQGNCDSFADDVAERVAGCWILEAGAFVWDESEHPAHLFIYYQNKFYDAAHPNGVIHWEDLYTLERKKKKASDDDSFDYFDDEMEVALSILHEYQQHKDDPNYRMQWDVVPAARLIKIWNDYMKTGFVRDEKGINMITGIILTNIAKLNVNTILCGHSPQDPVEYANDILGEEDELPEGYFAGDEAFFDDENGSWRLSDYALKPLSQYEWQLRQAKTAEEKLQLIDKILNVVHQRSDLAGWFVQGGQQTLNRLAGTGDNLKPTNPLLKKKKSGAVNKKYYHCSRVENADFIEEEGLLPSMPQEHEVSDGGIYLFSGYENAQQWAEKEMLPYINTAVDIWEVTPPDDQIIMKDTHLDLDGTGSYVTYEPIPPQYITHWARYRSDFVSE